VKDLLVFSEEVREALVNSKPIVALESTIITHGMPFPQNVKTALDVQHIVRKNGCVPATIAITEGRIRIGLQDSEIEYLGKQGEHAHKTSRRDLGYVLSQKLIGATTVSGTMVAAHAAGIRIFVTGGIGGVHRGGESSMDISADLTELGRTPVNVICAGVKSILDIGRTLEYLETQGVPVMTFGKTHDFPAFYAPTSGFKSPFRFDSFQDCAKFLQAQQLLELNNGIVIGVPIPQHAYEKTKDIEKTIQEGLQECEKRRVRGAGVTPFVLDYLAKKTSGQSLEANIELIKNNADIGSKITKELYNLGPNAISKPFSLDYSNEKY